MKIEKLHEFHDPEFSQGWADRFKPTPARLELFDTILAEVRKLPSDKTKVLELGIGPGYLAAYMLAKDANIYYEGLDYAKPMLNIAAKRNEAYKDRLIYTQADLTSKHWDDQVQNQPDAIVSTWALHDLFHQDNIFNVYRIAYNILPKGGILLNGDFIKPENSPFEYEGGRIKPSVHLALLMNAGFDTVSIIKELEKNVMEPTTANNYSCFMALK